MNNIVIQSIKSILLVSVIFLFLLWMMIYEESPTQYLVLVLDVVITAIVLLIIILKSVFAVFNIKMPKALAIFLRVITVILSIPLSILLFIFIFDSGKNYGTFVSVIRILLFIAVSITMVIYISRVLRPARNQPPD